MGDDIYVRGLLLRTVQSITSHPRAVDVEVDREADTVVTFVVTIDPNDIGTLGGNDGRIAHSLNIIVGAIGRKFGQAMSVEIDGRRR